VADHEDLTHLSYVVSRFGGPEQLELTETVTPPAPPGHVRLRLLAAGIGYADLMARRGEYLLQRRRPFTPGYDFVAEVVDWTPETEPGPGPLSGPMPDPDWLQPGVRVAACRPKMGAYAEYLTHPVAGLTPVPDRLDVVTAAVVPLDYLTALSALEKHGRTRAGDVVLVEGATGGVGDALCQLGSHHGLRLFGTASARSIDRLAGYPAVTAIDYEQQDARDVVHAAYPKGIRAVVDHLGGPGLRANARLLARGGTLVSLAFTARPGHIMRDTVTGAIRNGLLGLRPGRRTSVCILPNEVGADPAEHATRLRALLGLAAEGTLQPRVGAMFPFAEAAAAHRAMEERKTIGKVLLVAG